MAGRKTIEIEKSKIPPKILSAVRPHLPSAEKAIELNLSRGELKGTN